MTDWIPVNERLPDDNGVVSDTVLVCYWVNFPFGRQAIVEAGHHTQSTGWFDNHGNELPKTVTHWQPLPAPPEKQETIVNQKS